MEVTSLVLETPMTQVTPKREPNPLTPLLPSIIPGHRTHSTAWTCVLPSAISPPVLLLLPVGSSIQIQALLSKEREVQSAPQRRGGGHERPLCVLRITGRCAQGGQGQRTQEEWHELRSGVRAHHTHWETKPSDFERNCKPSLGASNWISR